MKRLGTKPDCRKMALRGLVAGLLLLVFISPSYGKAAAVSDRMAACAGIEDDGTRLKCFDELAGRKKTPAASVPAPPPRAETAAITQPPPDAPKPSVMSRHWELDEASRKKASIISPYRPNYFLPLAYNSSINRDVALDVDPRARAQHAEAKFQISFKIKLWEDILDKNMDLWFGYTQLAFWQLYNQAFSSPFREVDYEPELFVNFRTDYDLLGLKGRIITLGLDHQSNGRASPLSRSWNRVMASFGFEKENLNLLLKTWYRLPENATDDDNPDIATYMGYGEMWGFYYWNKHRFAAMLRNNLRVNNKGAVQLDWSFPIPFIKNDRFSGYIQYFNGYGESLIDYNKSVNRISLGFMLTDWR
jgi:phospholipase A1/A2